MKTMIKLEELAVFLLSIYLFVQLPYDWWLYPLLFLTPDVSFVGFLFGKSTGVVVYNVVHHKAVSISLIIMGGLLTVPVLSLVGVILLGHSSLDRVLGYELRELTQANQHTNTAGDVQTP